MRQLFATLFLSFPVFIWGASFTPSQALAADLPERHFDLHSYIAAYLDNSLNLKTQTNLLEMAHNDYKNAFTQAFLPSFTLSAQAGKEYDRDNRLSSWGEFRRAQSSARADGEWNLFNSGKDVLNYKSASLDWQISRIEYEDQLQQYVLDAADIYYTLVRARKLVNVYQDDLAVAEKQYEQDKVLYDNGLKTRSDVLQSETNWRSSQLSLFSAQNDYENALKNFNIALNRSVEAPVSLDEDIDFSIVTLPSLDQDLTYALAHRYDARSQRLALQQQDLQKTLDNLDTLPSFFVNLFASTGRGFNSHQLWDYNYGISAGITFDLGFFYLDKSRSRRNILLTNENAHLQYEQFLRTLRDAVVEARNTLLLQMRSLEISKLRLDTAQERFEATQLKYKNGLMSATDLTVARQELLSAQVDYVTLLCDLTLTYMKYQYALGNSIYNYQTEPIS